MQRSKFLRMSIFPASAFVFLGMLGCQPTGNTNTALVNSNANISNSLANASNLNTANTNSISSSTVEAREPDKYQATVKLSLEAVGDAQKTSLPTVGANVARDGADRAMEFTMPTNEKVIYLEKAGVNYLILPNRKQYAELTKEALGFEVRQMMSPNQIVNQVKGLRGVQVIGEETVNGREVTKYGYSGTANTQTRAGQVDTEAVLIIDKETGLPLRSETVSQSQSGGNVQGFKGMRLVTEMSNITTSPNANLFNIPTDYAKIDPEQVRAQVSAVFNVVAGLVGQAMKQAQTAPNTAATPVQ